MDEVDGEDGGDPCRHDASCPWASLDEVVGGDGEAFRGPGVGAVVGAEDPGSCSAGGGAGEGAVVDDVGVPGGPDGSPRPGPPVWLTVVGWGPDAPAWLGADHWGHEPDDADLEGSVDGTGTPAAGEATGTVVAPVEAAPAGIRP